mmetsp:Transcript_33489/g.50518  ORF Transcript_33489/g.50518 Transcript_33489/m.50518 type:complete len:207 (-) Transcript_33489:919-1539(-)
MRSINMVSSQSKWRASSGLPQSSTRSRAFSWDRGKPSRSIRFPGWSFMTFCMRVTIIAELTSSPAFMISSTFFPKSVPFLTSLRKRSPEDRWTKPHSLASLSLNTPLPEPGPPTKRIIPAGRPARNVSLLARKSLQKISPSPSKSATSNSFWTQASVGCSPIPSNRSLTSCQSIDTSPFSRTLPYCCIRSKSTSWSLSETNPDAAP